jgi:5-methylcytosine-specific restriction endonuclease McrA
MATTTPRSDRLVAEARRARELREQGYRAQALKLFPHVCGRCARGFEGPNLRMLTVHHKDGNHDNNAPDGSNWELLCLYCHDAEHSRLLDNAGRSGAAEDSGHAGTAATHRPFAALESLLKPKGEPDK